MRKTGAEASSHQRENEELAALRKYVHEFDPGQRHPHNTDDDRDACDDAWQDDILHISDKIKRSMCLLLVQGGLYTFHEYPASYPSIVVYRGEEPTMDGLEGPGAWGMVFKFMLEDGSPMILTWAGRGEEGVPGERWILMYSTNNSYLYGFPGITRIA
jgi:hypothetical protein